MHRELRRKGATLLLIWQEYKATTPDGFQYSWFCQAYRKWAAKLDVVMRQRHRAGEKLFVDYAGHSIEIVSSLELTRFCGNLIIWEKGGIHDAKNTTTISARVSQPNG